MKPKEIIQQIEHLMGRQPEGYMIRLMNDGLLDMSAKKQEYTVSSTTNLVQYKRWYALDDQMIDITKIEILDSNDRYIRIPKLVDSHLLLRDDTESGADTLK